ncbi:MAG: RNA polymerase sigma factor [Gammaproteobacteria bacterium]
MRADDTDETLMLRYRDGDARAFEALYTRHKGPLFRYLLRQCGNTTNAEELFQDIWFKLVRARNGYSVKAKFTTYLYHMAHNRLIDHYRAQARGLPLSYSDDPDDDVLDGIPAAHHDQPDQREDRRRQVERLLALLGMLPEAQREAFLLREEAGLSLEEIAQATGVPPETAKSRLRYALAKLRSGMGGES